jgi:hypothetical protein
MSGITQTRICEPHRVFFRGTAEHLSPFENMGLGSMKSRPVFAAPLSGWTLAAVGTEANATNLVRLLWDAGVHALVEPVGSRHVRVSEPAFLTKARATGPDLAYRGPTGINLPNLHPMGRRVVLAVYESAWSAAPLHSSLSHLGSPQLKRGGNGDTEHAQFTTGLMWANVSGPERGFCARAVPHLVTRFPGNSVDTCSELDEPSLAETLWEAGATLPDGSILLVNLSYKIAGPASVSEPCRKVIAELSKRVVVVLPLGNDSVHVELPAGSGDAVFAAACGTDQLTHESTSLLRSGAPEHQRFFSHGENVWSPGGVDAGHSYSGTSASSAILAGAFAVAQSMVIAHRGRPMAPGELILRLYETGRNEGNGAATTTLGRQPDLSAFQASLLSHTL